MTIQELRKALNVPKDQRIAQFIYNQCEDYEDSIDVMVKHDGKFIERSVKGIDIFYVEDKEFISLLEK